MLGKFEILHLYMEAISNVATGYLTQNNKDYDAREDARWNGRLEALADVLGVTKEERDDDVNLQVIRQKRKQEDKEASHEEEK